MLYDHLLISFVIIFETFIDFCKVQIIQLTAPTISLQKTGQIKDMFEFALQIHEIFHLTSFIIDIAI